MVSPLIPFSPAGHVPWNARRLIPQSDAVFAQESRPLPSVLAIDDHPGVSRSVAEILSDLFDPVDTANTPTEALQMLRKRSYDLVISDLQMPYIDGLTLLERLRTLDIQTPVILLSAHITPDITLRAFQLGVIDLVPKPLTPSSVRLAVRDVLQRYAPGAGRKDPLIEIKQDLNHSRFDEARVLLELLLDREENADARILLAMTYEVLGFYEKAERHYKMALKDLDPDQLKAGSSLPREWLLGKTAEK
jgi:CheY-like chemotaxis protein